MRSNVTASLPMAPASVAPVAQPSSFAGSSVALGHLPFARETQPPTSVSVVWPLAIIGVLLLLSLAVRRMRVEAGTAPSTWGGALVRFMTRLGLGSGATSGLPPATGQWELIQRQHLAHGTQLIEGRWQGQHLLLAIDRQGGAQLLAIQSPDQAHAQSDAIGTSTAPFPECEAAAQSSQRPDAPVRRRRKGQVSQT